MKQIEKLVITSGRNIWVNLNVTSKGTGTYEDPFRDPQDAFDLARPCREDVIIQMPELELNNETN